MSTKIISLEELPQLAEALVSEARQTQKNIIALKGELGAGKTTLVQNLAKSLGIEQEVTSPTFVVMKIYAIPNNLTYKRLIHFDLYRLQTWDDVELLGIEEAWSNATNLIVIEWPERIAGHIPKQQVMDVLIEYAGEKQRKITIH